MMNQEAEQKQNRNKGVFPDWLVSVAYCLYWL